MAYTYHATIHHANGQMNMDMIASSVNYYSAMFLPCMIQVSYVHSIMSVSILMHLSYRCESYDCDRILKMVTNHKFVT